MYHTYFHLQAGLTKMKNAHFVSKDEDWFSSTSTSVAFRLFRWTVFPLSMKQIHSFSTHHHKLRSILTIWMLPAWKHPVHYLFMWGCACECVCVGGSAQVEKISPRWLSSPTIPLPLSLWVVSPLRFRGAELCFRTWVAMDTSQSGDFWCNFSFLLAAKQR